jgi:hypothetical protein
VRQALADSSFDGFTVLTAQADSSEVDFSYGVVDQLASSLPREMRVRHQSRRFKRCDSSSGGSRQTPSSSSW